MGFLGSCYEALLYLTSIYSLLDAGKFQHPLSTDGLTFHPHSPHIGASPGFQCQYPNLKGWESCNSASNRSCWLTPPKDSKVPLAPFDIHTDYETIFPEGVTREYWLTTDNVVINADGFPKLKGKAFNGTYPGPLIEACWGDELVIHVTNNMMDNGTTIHWHGIRQLNTTEMDGVNGVTQCPIPYGQTFTYKLRAWQYGHTWYHSHYSLQYADGVAAPLVIHGPTSANYDEGLHPVIISDWVHDTSFRVFQEELIFQVPQTDSMVVNGKGHWNCNGTKSERDRCNDAETYTTKIVKKGKRYLLRLINGSASTAYQFSIDNHTLEVISNDLVPIVPYKTDSVHIAIGQRYGVIVEADQVPGNYWMRTNLLTCFNMSSLAKVDETAIWRYEGADTKALPTTTGLTTNLNITTGAPHDPQLACVDEPAASLVPVVPWFVQDTPLNFQKLQDGDDIFLATHTSNITLPNGTVDQGIFHGYQRWTLTDTPLWLDFAEPTILNLDNTSFLDNPQIALVDYNYHSSTGFVYIVISANITHNRDRDSFNPFPFPVAHPIHMHGHDFAIIASGSGAPYDEALRNGGVHLNFKNPPRRDVAFLDGLGYLVLAFRPDNPGTWLLHCHIAWHASSGLALQILEDRNNIDKSVGKLQSTKDTCKEWIASPFRNAIDYEQNDSGI